ncbi:hypothetical protein BC829DRAFT_551 [Chytridium lagenaria]|nr:hypothetical protein BC829DRAFT_551 [Chytridium lagenaria]
MRFFTGDTVEILQPNGSTSKRVNGSWTSTSIDGKRLTTTSTGEITSTSPIRSMKETHISLGRIIESREDAVSLTLTRDGEAIADHADRTRIVSRFAGDAGPVDARVSPWTTMKPKSVVVSGEGFGSVTMDFEKGVEIKFPNGATLRRVVKEEDGTRSFKFRMEQNNSTLEFSSTGKAIFRPNKASSETYNLNWVTGEFLIVDDESYEITVSREGKAEGRYLQNIKSPGPAPVPHLPPTTVLDFLRSSKCLKSPSPPIPLVFLWLKKTGRVLSSSVMRTCGDICNDTL